jgi:hypothetical protein
MGLRCGANLRRMQFKIITGLQHNHISFLNYNPRAIGTRSHGSNRFPVTRFSVITTVNRFGLTDSVVVILEHHVDSTVVEMTAFLEFESVSLAAEDKTQLTY